jgi:hypothetical protein
MGPCSVTASVVREGRRLVLVDVVMRQEGHDVARAGALFLSPSSSPSGQVSRRPPPAARPPYGVEVGLVATDRVEADGIAVGTVTMLDRGGVLGGVVVTALANEGRPVDFEKVRYTDDGRRHRVEAH